MTAVLDRGERAAVGDEPTAWSQRRTTRREHPPRRDRDEQRDSYERSATTFQRQLVFLLPGSSTASTAKHTVNPIIDITLGVLILLIAVRVGRGRDRRLRARRERKKRSGREQAAAALEARI